MRDLQVVPYQTVGIFALVLPTQVLLTQTTSHACPINRGAEIRSQRALGNGHRKDNEHRGDMEL